MTACGRCKKSVVEADAEYCWYCIGYLCASCWDDFGHCGHPEATKFEKDANERHAKDQQVP